MSAVTPLVYVPIRQGLMGHPVPECGWGGREAARWGADPLSRGGHAGTGQLEAGGKEVDGAPDQLAALSEL